MDSTYLSLGEQDIKFLRKAGIRVDPDDTWVAAAVRMMNVKRTEDVSGFSLTT
jgi:hypothetical protein